MSKTIALLIYLAACGAALAQTAIRPDQISPGTPDITWGPNAAGTGYVIGTTVAWRTITTTPIVATDFATTDNAKIIELTAAPTITTTLPLATGAFGDGAGFTLQVKTGTLTLNPTSPNTINGKTSPTSITVGPYQSVSLLSKGGNWYAALSVPQPSAQTGANVLKDNMTWAASGGGAPTSNYVLTAHTGKSAVGGANATTTAINTASPAADLIVVHVMSYTGAGAGALTDSAGNAWTTVDTIANSTAADTLYYKRGPTTSATHTFSFGGAGATYSSIQVAAFSGSSATPLDQHIMTAMPASVTTASAGSITPTVNNTLIIASIGYSTTADNATAATIGSSFIFLDGNGAITANSYGGGMAYLIQSTAAAVNPVWTLPTASAASSVTGAVALAAFK